jgi:hypothetical protein
LVLIDQVGVFIGGGRRHHVKYNAFEACDTAIHFDDRGLNWQASNCAPGGDFIQDLESYNYMEPPYLTAYPFLENIMSQVGRRFHTHTRSLSFGLHAGDPQWLAWGAEPLLPDFQRGDWQRRVHLHPAGRFQHDASDPLAQHTCG